LGGFDDHLADSRKLEVSTANQSRNLDEFVDNLDELLLPYLTGEIERMSIFDVTSTRGAPGLRGSDSNQSEEACTLFQFRLCNATSVNKEATRSKSLSNLEEDLDCLLKKEDKGATAYQGGPIFNNYSDLDEKYSLMKSTQG
jgi:hypothetical protein